MTNEFSIGTFGEGRVGKTCILRRYLENKFDEEELSTTSAYNFEHIEEYNNQNYTLTIYDTAGQERYGNLTNQYINGLNGLFLVYDITSRETFNKINMWVERVKERLDINKVAIILIGNKCDCEDNREVSADEGKNLANNLNIKFFETSAATGYNVKEAFVELLKKLIELNGESNLNKIKLKHEKKNNKKFCF